MAQNSCLSNVPTALVDLGRIELPPPQCECGVIPLDHRPTRIVEKTNNYQLTWCPRVESNDHLRFRSPLFPACHRQCPHLDLNQNLRLRSPLFYPVELWGRESWRARNRLPANRQRTVKEAGPPLAETTGAGAAQGGRYRKQSVL